MKPINSGLVFNIIASERYKPFAEVTKESILRYYPGAQILIQEPTSDKAWVSTQHESETANVLASRPACILDLFEQGYHTVVHLGADVVFYTDPRSFISNNVGSIAAAPHLLDLPRTANESRWISLTGILNSDVVIYRNYPETLAFLKWQKQMLAEVCASDVHNGHFYDQQYLQMAMTLPSFCLIEDVGVNVAYYNMHEEGRPLRREDGLHCFQFSGYDIKRPLTLSKYNLNPKLQTLQATKLLLDYRERLIKAGLKINVEAPKEA